MFFDDDGTEYGDWQNAMLDVTDLETRLKAVQAERDRLAQERQDQERLRLAALADFERCETENDRLAAALAEADTNLRQLNDLWSHGLVKSAYAHLSKATAAIAAALAGKPSGLAAENERLQSKVKRLKSTLQDAQSYAGYAMTYWKQGDRGHVLDKLRDIWNGIDAALRGEGVGDG